MAESIPQAPQAVNDEREEYEAPELRVLGDHTALTETLASGVGADGPYS